MSALSYFTVADLGRGVAGRLYFPGRHSLPEGSVGYVRSEPRARRAVTQNGGELPWRDYPSEVLTPSSDVLPKPFDDDLLLVGCRNVLNEWGYQLRLDGQWWRRGGDDPIDATWPVLATFKDGVRFIPAHECDATSADAVSGLPLVTGGKPSELDFLIAHGSDIAHMFEVHPQGAIGPSAQAWLELSNAWQHGRDRGLDEHEIAQLMHETARKFGVAESSDNLHSILAQTSDGDTFIFAISGPLLAISQHLATHWRIANAILLDNGGSVGWLYCKKGSDTPRLLVGGANRRENGTAFLALAANGFPRPRMHECLRGV